MQTFLDPRLKELVAHLSDRNSLCTWLLEGSKRIILYDVVPSQAFSPGVLLIGCNPDCTWEKELRLIYREFLSLQQKDWFRECLPRAIEEIDPHRDAKKAENYLTYLLATARALGTRELDPYILLGLINQRFPCSQDVFDSVLLTWCTLPTGVEFSGSCGPLSASEQLLDYILQDCRYAPQPWMIHLLVAIVRKVPAKVLEHLNRFTDDASLALARVWSDRQRQATLFELEVPVEKGLIRRQKFNESELIRVLRGTTRPVERQRPSRSIYNINPPQAGTGLRDRGTS